MSLTIERAERSSGYCKNCGDRIMAGDKRLKIYSAHHGVSWCNPCVIEVFPILVERMKNE